MYLVKFLKDTSYGPKGLTTTIDSVKGDQLIKNGKAKLVTDLSIDLPVKKVIKSEKLKTSRILDLEISNESEPA